MHVSKRKAQNRLRFDLYVCVILVGVSSLATIYFHTNMFLSSILYFLLPAGYLFIRKTKSPKRIFVATTTAVAYAAAIDIYCLANKAWVTPSVFPALQNQIISFEDLFFFTTWTLFLITFYEHFLDHDRSDKLSKHFLTAFLLSLAVFTLTLFVRIIFPTLLLLPFAYLIFIIANLPFFIFFIVRHPSLLSKF